MPMIALKDGTHINSDHVVQFTTFRNGQTKFLLSTGGEPICEPYSDVNEHFTPVIQANPGFVAVFANRGDDGVFSYRHRSVIAWRLYPSGNYPNFEGHGDNDDYAAIIDPSGGVFDSDQNQFATIEDWMKEFEAGENDIAARMAEAK